jgi:hypothetical protein
MVKGGHCTQRTWDSDANFWRGLADEVSNVDFPKPEDEVFDEKEIPDLEPVVDAKIASLDGWNTDDEEKDEPVRISRSWKNHAMSTG